MRRLIAALAVALAWLSLPALAAEQCTSHDKVLADAKWALPNATHVLLGQIATSRLINGVKREEPSASELEGDSAIVFADPTKPNFLVVTFLGTCARQTFAIPPNQYNRIMKGVST